jgi:YD repeat-containing protein
MKQKRVELIVAVLVMVWAAAGFAQTNLTVVRHADNTIWALTCDGTSTCSSWEKIGRTAYVIRMEIGSGDYGSELK